ncbi:MAG: thiosulfate oxidation carrier protein SoxY [Ahrensia sp.]|nr:thiosulfate oxidation carrier protein SoxY [Ahrensia sp.]
MLNRRDLIKYGSAGAAVAVLGVPQLALAETVPTTDDRIKEFTGGAQIGEGKVSLSTPEIAENGNTVPVEVSVESPMTAEDHVAEVLILADGNPRPGVATFKFTEMSGEAFASTRIRLAMTQDVVAVAKMSDGTFQMARNTVKVTIGGCGG